jgi:hypothetical protein
MSLDSETCKIMRFDPRQASIIQSLTTLIFAFIYLAENMKTVSSCEW